MNEKFVCFAPGWFINSKDEVYQAAWKRFYVGKPNPDEGNGWLRGTQLVLMTSAGKLLAGSVKDRNGLAKALREVLDAYAKLPEADRRAKSVGGEVQPQPAPPPGGLVLTIYDRPLGRDADGRYRHPEGDDLGGFRTHAPHGQRSSLWLTEAECNSLVPPNPKKGQTINVPTRLAKRIFLYGLVPQTLWVVEESWKPDSVRASELRLTVEEVSAQAVRMRIHGSVLLTGPGVLHEWPERKFIKNVENRYDAKLEGVIVYDRAKKLITRWDMTVLGDYSGRWFAGNKGWKEATPEAPLALGFGFEVDSTAYALPPERRRPRSFVHAYIFRNKEEHYWDPDEWLDDWKKRQPKPKAKEAPPDPPKMPFDAATAQRYQREFAERTGLPVEFTNGIGMTFVLVPPGTFVMGSPKEEPGHGTGGYDETPHEVTLSRPFYLAKHEVTVGQFRRFVEATKHVTDAEKTDGGHAHDEKAVWKHHPGTYWRQPGYARPFELKDDHPVVHVSHNDATAFCQWLQKQPPGDRGPEGTHDLPTEAQWEWACRAGSTARFWWGADEDSTGKVANVGDRRLKRVHPDWPRTVMPMDDGHAFPAPVGSYRANGFGLHDMLGNVWEFCSTRYGPYPKGPVTDPEGGDPKRGFAVRGGGWSNVPADVRCATRNADLPTFCHSNLGFRLALTLPSAAH